MTANSGLSTLSNHLFVSAVVVYALAMLGFAIDTAAGARSGARTPRLQPTNPAEAGCPRFSTHRSPLMEIDEIAG